MLGLPQTVTSPVEQRNGKFRKWAGNVPTVYLAIVFTDMVGSTDLDCQIGDACCLEVRKQHFDRARRLIQERGGYLIKTIGDAVMAVFRNGVDALNFALTLEHATGHDRVTIRAGVHAGQVELDGDDVFGRNVNMAARIVAKAKTGVWVSDQVRNDVLCHGEDTPHEWTAHPHLTLKGFQGRYTLWSVKKLS